MTLEGEVTGQTVWMEHVEGGKQIQHRFPKAGTALPTAPLATVLHGLNPKRKWYYLPQSLEPNPGTPDSRAVCLFLVYTLQAERSNVSVQVFSLSSCLQRL
ncbi:unnamed protein product [Echinostoma caproni]|uniref:Uncharacterized protein n=1 Tax=Echinostoma caproni TaxID=27848 RepID=A0A183A2S3_9TREM|nr:unnamed protein product [Echinostoma caproni]